MSDPQSGDPSAPGPPAPGLPAPGPPATDAERARAFQAERQRQVRAQLALVAETEAEVRRLLADALVRIKAELAGTPSAFAEWRLGQLRREVERVLGETGTSAAAATGDGLSRSWDAGVALVDAPLEAAGVVPQLVALDRTVLGQMQAFTTDRIRAVTTETMNRIGGELGLVMIGARTPYEAVQTVAAAVGGGEARAVGIVRTELGRAWSAATQARQEQAVAAGVTGMRKQWRRSGRRHPRWNHEAIDGQVRKVDEPFQLAGGVTLMFPRDPKGPAKETINCGCVALPLMAHWEVVHPRERPFTRPELDASPQRRLLDDARVQGFHDWADALMSGRLRPSGRAETVGSLPPAVLAAVRAAGFQPATAEIAITDRELLGFRAARKVTAKPGRLPIALPEATIRDLPALLAAPRAVLRDKQVGGMELLFVIDIPNEPRLGKVIVKLRDHDSRVKNGARRHNWITSGGLVPQANLNDPAAYDRLDRPGVPV